MDNKTSKPNRSWLLVAIVAILFLSLFRMGPNVSPVRDLTQVEFFKLLDENKIVEPVVRMLDHDEGATYLMGEAETDELQKDGSPIREKYRVMLVPGENEDLMNELFKEGVQFTVREKRSLLSPMVVNILFMVGIMVFFYFMFARRMGGENGPFGFGKSRAKMLNGKEDKRKVTFADVAGVDEAKEEVQEIVEFLKKPDDFRRLGGRIPKGVLLVGPPGTGKTLLARAIAGEAQIGRAHV